MKTGRIFVLILRVCLNLLKFEYKGAKKTIFTTLG